MSRDAIRQRKMDYNNVKYRLYTHMEKENRQGGGETEGKGNKGK